MSQGDLGKRLDIHRTVWGRIERGFGGITVERLLLVAQLLKVSPLWLLGDDGKTLPDLTPRS